MYICDRLYNNLLNMYINGVSDSTDETIFVFLLYDMLTVGKLNNNTVTIFSLRDASSLLAKAKQCLIASSNKVPVKVPPLTSINTFIKQCFEHLKSF